MEVKADVFAENTQDLPESLKCVTQSRQTARAASVLLLWVKLENLIVVFRSTLSRGEFCLVMQTCSSFTGLCCQVLHTFYTHCPAAQALPFSASGSWLTVPCLLSDPFYRPPVGTSCSAGCHLSPSWEERRCPTKTLVHSSIVCSFASIAIFCIYVYICMYFSMENIIIILHWLCFFPHY